MDTSVGSSSEFESDEDEWEDVEETTSTVKGSQGKSIAETCSSFKQQSIQEDNRESFDISIDIPGSSNGKEKRVRHKYDWAKYVQSQVNHFNKGLQVQKHKVHLVCLLGSALHSSEICNSTDLQALALSQVPIHLFLGKSSSFDMKWFTKLIIWFSTSYELNPQVSRETASMLSITLAYCIEYMSASVERDIVHVYLITMRALGLQARLVQSLQPIPIKHNVFTKVSRRSIEAKKKSGKRRKKCTEQDETDVEPKREAITESNKNISVGQTSRDKEASSDGDFEKTLKTNVSQSGYSQSSILVKKTSKRKILSSDSSDDDMDSHCITNLGSDNWIEVYDPSDKRWICVDCIRGHINRPDLCEQNATKPISYVIAVDNENCVKDVTKRYALKWMFETEKLQVPSDWWEDTLQPYHTHLTKRDSHEDQQLNKQLRDKPLPTRVSEYKNHHMYVLKRHLLKFEALYPESPPILGYCRGEPVFARECVHTLHTRETWLKQGLSIVCSEKAYKMVKARPKQNKSHESLVSVYGKWQTELYIPPPAVDGKVPRNEYGNVEIFQPSMLPMGTVHLQVPGLKRTARRLEIDCVPAMVGWDYHAGFCHPVLDGFIVCKEVKDILLDAWDKEQANIELNNKKKREKQVLKNWRKLTNGVLLRERLNKRFQIICQDGYHHSTEDRDRSWPQNKLTTVKGDKATLLPFEK